jgi:hypothetical protein
LKKVILKFKSAQELWEFCKVASLKVIKVNLRERTLCCECDEAQIELAANGFGATTTHVAE